MKTTYLRRHSARKLFTDGRRGVERAPSEIASRRRFPLAAKVMLSMVAVLALGACPGNGITPVEGIPTGVVEGTVTLDGVPQPGVAVAIELRTSSGTQREIVVTDGDGNYLADLPVGTASNPTGAEYHMQLVQPLGEKCNDASAHPNALSPQTADIACATIAGTYEGTGVFESETCGLGPQPNRDVEFALTTQQVGTEIEVMMEIPLTPPLSGTYDRETSMLEVTTGEHDVGQGFFQTQTLTLELGFDFDDLPLSDVFRPTLAGEDQSRIRNPSANLDCLIVFGVDLIRIPTESD